MQLTCATDAPPIKCGVEWCIRHSCSQPSSCEARLNKSERKRCPLLTTPPHCKKSADRSVRIERQSGVRAYAAIAEIAVKAGPSFAGLS
ncbi:hypothetical protein EVAR_54776_1 [Eumeta japonica]|uniref:Uncharacterized protein n=1 Tax=Eumeta variegata TaxID=151549 RepID=A0A4C1YEK4_EUMVA|nr:hypothetical protein EVAR_54776_1 [Eumeta japonica]